MTLSGLGLSPGDSCYDPNRHWYSGLWMTDAECACVAAEGRDIHEQCASFHGVIQAIGGDAGSLIGSAASGVGEGIGEGIGAGVSNFTESVNFSGVILLGLVGLAIYTLKR